MDIPKDQIKGIECRFAVFCPPNEDNPDDLHVVKEIIHLKDGTCVPHLRRITNFQRPFWVTKKGMQNHKDKKEWEDLSSVLEFKSTQSQLLKNAARALGMPWFKGDLRRLARSPYLYGTDILSTAVLKRMYQDKYPDLVSQYTAAMYDIETDVVRGTDDIIMGTLSFKDRVFTAIHKDHVVGYSGVIARLQEKLQHYLGPYVEKRKINWEVVIVDSEAQIVQEVFKRAHEWKPDFVAIWNIDFDFSKSVKALEKAGIEPRLVFADPSVPDKFKYLKYKQGSKQKVTASGKVTPIKPSAQWHTVYCPASFYFIDAMCAYRHIRNGSQEEPSYALDPILEKNLGIRKLKFQEAEGLHALDWHQFMQERYPLEYVIYNVFDCVSMEELDEKTNDLSLSLPLFSGCSDFENFKSQPRRLADNLHFFCLERGKVMGSTSDQMADDFDKETIGLDGWIVTLPAHLVMDNGLNVILENEWLRTNIRGHVADLDVSASYPNGGSVFNISKETTHRELCRIRDVPELVQRMQGINLSAGHVNAVEICTELFKLPTMETLLRSFQNKQILI